MTNFKDTANFIWAIADLLRVDNKQSDYNSRAILPTVLRCPDYVLETNKPAVLA